MRNSYAFLLCISWLFMQTAAIAPNAEASAPSIPQPEKEWTFLVFLNGHNNLDDYGTMNLNEMEKVGSTANVNVVVQWASLNNKDTLRLYVQKDNDPQKVTSPVVQNAGDVDMGDWRSLVEFVRWGVANFPAKHYFINVWNHGSGWHALKGVRGGFEVNPMDISWDDHSGHSISTQQLGQALAESAKIIGHKVDIYGSDACLMAMAEVADEMADSVSVFVGSEEVEPVEGWPYDALLKPWTEKPQMSAIEIGKIITQAYVSSYQGGSHGTQEVTFSALDLSKISKFDQAIAGLGSAMGTLNAADKTKVLESVKNTQSFAISDYGDLGDFLSLVEKAKVEGVRAEAISSVRDAMKELIIANADTSSYAKAKGLAIWLPNFLDSYTSYADKYQALKFSAHTHWGDALQALLKN
jgi:hypothetical protein